MGFFESFLTNIQQSETKLDKRLTASDFRDFIIQKEGKNINTIKLFKNSIISTMRKHQRCLLDENNYYLANDVNTNTYYICFKDLMMIDLDFKDKNKDKSLEDLLKNIEDFCLTNPEFLFDVFKSNNGIHAFAIHKAYNYNDDNTLQIMLDLDCDFYYVIYTAIRGWSIRLNKKKTEINKTDNMYQYIKRIGTGKLDKNCEKNVSIHYNSMLLFQNKPPCKMK